MSLIEPANNIQKIEYGKDALMRYQNQAVSWYGDKWPYDYQTLLDEINKRDKNEDRAMSFLETVGDAAKRSGLGMRRMNEAMERVVNNTSISPLKIPKAGDFVKGITDELSSFDFSMLGDASLDLANAVVKPFEDAAKGIGDSVSFLGKNLKWIVLVIVGLIVFIGYGVVKKKADV